MNTTLILNTKSSNKVFEFVIAFSLSLIYFYAITLLARTTVLFEIFLCLIIPAMICYLNKYSNSAISYRVMQLIIIESVYMLFVILSKTSIFFDKEFINYLISYGFFGLFACQFVFFMLYQYKVKSYLGIIRTLMFLVLVFPWFYDANLYSTVDAQGRFLMWGEEAPTLIILYYCFWVIGVPLVDSRTLPNFKSALFHFSSVSIAVWSQEFFHVRLLTASHLFILDSLVGFSKKEGGNLFCVLSDNQFEFYQKHIRKKIDYFTMIGCFSIFVAYVCRNYSC